MAVNQDDVSITTPSGASQDPDNPDRIETTPRLRRGAISIPRIQYLDGLPLLPPASPRLKPLPAAAAAAAAQARESARGKCRGCTLAGSRCEFAAETKPVGTCCARCRRVGGTCLLRRPLRQGAAPPTYEVPRDWVAAEMRIEDEEAAALARKMLDEGPRGGKRDVCGVLVAERDVKQWACPGFRKDVSEEVRENVEGEVSWRTVLPRKTRVVADPHEY